MQRASFLAMVAIASFLSPLSAAAEPPLAERYLHEGKLAEGETALLAELSRNPKNDQARLGLGALQFVQAVERMGQSLHRFGVRSERGRRFGVPFLRLPVPSNAQPEVITYSAARTILQVLIDDLTKAEATLANVQDEQVKLPLRVGLIRLDFADDGAAGEPFNAVLAGYVRAGVVAPEDTDMLIVFDRGDVAWLRGYCHLLMALAETALAYDGQELFDCTAHVFFRKVETPHQFLAALPDDERGPFGGGINFVDLIAFVHLVRMPVEEPERMKAALNHLERMLELSSESWKFILAETDDDDEWIPNPKQKGVLGIGVTQEMVDSWLEFVGETETLLAGKRLVPFWRGTEKRGVNLRRVFTEPRRLDLVLWVQGTAATPYLEEGDLTEPAVWQRLLRVFRGEFIGFALWFN